MLEEPVSYEIADLDTFARRPLAKARGLEEQVKLVEATTPMTYERGWPLSTEQVRRRRFALAMVCFGTRTLRPMKTT